MQDSLSASGVRGGSCGPGGWGARLAAEHAVGVTWKAEARLPVIFLLFGRAGAFRGQEATSARSRLCVELLRPRMVCVSSWGDVLLEGNPDAGSVLGRAGAVPCCRVTSGSPEAGGW